MLVIMKKEAILFMIAITISTIKAQSDDSEGSGTSEGEAYAALGILCALAILFIIVCYSRYIYIQYIH